MHKIDIIIFDENFEQHSILGVNISGPITDVPGIEKIPKYKAIILNANE